jgi:RNA-splicing ligase RtcB
MAYTANIASSVLMVCAGADRRHLGTAWVCAPGLAVTAWHVVNGATSLVLISNNGMEATAEYADHSESFDVALLCFDRNTVTVTPLPMNDDGDWSYGDKWSGYGFPIGFPSGFPVDGTVSSSGFQISGYRRMSLNCLQGPKPQIRGLSGAPVLDQNGAVIGLLTGYPQDLEQVTLFATRLDDAWRHLPRWRGSMPDWPSHGSISQYLSQRMSDWDRPTYRVPFLRRELPHLSAIFVSPRFRKPHVARQQGQRSPGETQTANSLLENLHQDGRNLVLRGDPGTGKSVLLRWLAAQACEGWKLRHTRAFVPIIVHASVLAHTDYQDAMQASLGRFEFSLPQGSSWLLLVDGLDEVVDIDERRRVIDRLQNRSLSPLVFRNNLVKFILASRPLALLDELSPSETQHFVLQPFTHQQLEAFAQAWFKGNSGPRMAASFVEEICLSRLEGLASIPALATMAAVVFELSTTKTLPRRRSELYDRFIDLMLLERSDQAWQGFVTLCQRAVRGQGGEKLAAGLWEARLPLATELAVEIQEGRIGLTTDDLVVQSVRIAQKLELLSHVTKGSLGADQQWMLMQNLLLDSGLFVRSFGGHLEFFHNTLREALVARAITENTAVTATPSSMWPFVRRWSEPRWREIILIALARWSEQGNAAPDAIWQLLRPVMYSSRRGLHFVGMAVAEGVLLPASKEARITKALLDRLGAWNPCSEVFSEFASPNPLDVLQLLTRREHFVTLLIDELKQEPEKCRIRMWAFLELTLDQAGAGEIRQFLNYGGEVRLAAAVLLARSGEGKETAGILIDALRLHNRDSGVREMRRIAEVVAEYCPPESLQCLLSSEIPAETRLIAALAGWRRTKDDALQSEATKLFAFSQLDTTDDIALVRRALSIPKLAIKRPHSVSTCIALLAAMCPPPFEDEISSPDWVHTLFVDQSESLELRAYACSVALYVEPGNVAANSCAPELVCHPQVPGEAKQALLNALAHNGNDAELEEFSRRDSLPVKTRFAAVLARMAIHNIEETRPEIEHLLALLPLGEEEWASCVSMLEHAGYFEMVADKYVNLVLSGDRRGSAYIRKLMEMGCVMHIGRILHGSGANPITLQFAVRCLGQIGDTQQILAVTQDSAIPVPVRMHATTQLKELGWVQEAETEAQLIGNLLGGRKLNQKVQELEAYAMAIEVAKGNWPPSVLAMMASETQIHLPIWQDRLTLILNEPELSSEDVIAIMKALGSAAPLDIVLERCIGKTGDIEAFLEIAGFALDRNDLSVALHALSLAINHPDGLCFLTINRLEKCTYQTVKAAVTEERIDVNTRLWTAKTLARRDLLNYEAVKGWLALIQHENIDLDDRMESLTMILKTDFCQGEAIALLTRMAIETGVGPAEKPELVWARIAQVAKALESVGATEQARKVAQIPLTKGGLTAELEDENCVAALLVLARCGGTRLVRKELRTIAAGYGAFSQRVEAARALARFGDKRIIPLLHSLCLERSDDEQDTAMRIIGIEALLESGAFDEAANAALTLVQKCDDRESSNCHTLEGLWGRATLRGQSK